jgi:hypothetical protein
VRSRHERQSMPVWIGVVEHNFMFTEKDKALIWDMIYKMMPKTNPNIG